MRDSIDPHRLTNQDLIEEGNLSPPTILPLNDDSTLAVELNLQDDVEEFLEPCKTKILPLDDNGL